MSLILRTVSQSNLGTFGLLILDDKTLCHTCEDPWNNNKVGDSCIPAGKYQCKPHNGAKYKDVWEITNVPGRTAILIHAGNFITDTRGCVLVGDGFLRDEHMKIIGVSNSKATLNKLREILPDYFTLTVER